MKKVLLLAALCYAHFFATGQSADNYLFEVQTGVAYTPLDTGTNLTQGLLWDFQSFKVPLGFTSKIGDKTTTDFSIITRGVFGLSSDTQGIIHAFFPISSLLTDRSFTADPPQSPIRYIVEGIAPNRIFKLEFFNAGFYTELFYYRTNNDFVSFQVWLYETSDIVELRYGPSRISNPEDYFGNPGPGIGYIRNVDAMSFDTEKFYYLFGDPDNPSIDSLANPKGIPLPSMDAYPDSGTIYRFTPKSPVSSIGKVDITKYFSVYPTLVSDMLGVDYELSGAVSAQIIDISGRSIKSSLALKSGRNQVDVGDLSRGQYFIRVSNEKGNAVFRFVKQ